MSRSAGITALAVYFPEHVRTNEYWRERHGEVISSFEQRIAKQVWEGSPQAKTLFASEMAPYLGDVFRGSVERRVVVPGENALAMETRVARRALKAAKLSPSDIDYVLITSFFPDQYLHGNGVMLARELGLTCPAWNTESACGSAVTNLLLAASLVESGRADNVLVVISCTYSRAFDETNPMSWTSGDGASAFIVSRVEDGYGVRGSKAFNTKETVGSFESEVRPHPEVGQTLMFSSTKVAGRAIDETSERMLPACCRGAAEDAGVRMEDISFFALPTPTAWFSSFAQKKLGFSADRTVDTYTRFSNIGPVLTPANLYYGAREGKIAKGDLVMFHSLGSVSSAGAVVLRWGDVAVADETD